MIRVGLVLAIFALCGGESGGADHKLCNPFFAFDNGTGRGVVAPEDQARMLAELGYAGIGYTGTSGIPQMLKALDGHKLKMFSIYVGARVGKDGPTFDPNLKTAIGQLKGRDTVIWLTVQGSIDDDDQQAVRVVREVADLADKAGLRVALYPHFGLYVATTSDALRVVDKADRRNLGVSFNLCHWLRAGKEPDLHALLKKALPRLTLVSINGADRAGGWKELIQTLDHGNFDVYQLLTELNGLGYRGPIGLQCYNVTGDRLQNLTASIGAWNKFVARMDGE